jgi:hypothetical protein
MKTSTKPDPEKLAAAEAEALKRVLRAFKTWWQIGPGFGDSEQLDELVAAFEDARKTIDP